MKAAQYIKSKVLSSYDSYNGRIESALREKAIEKAKVRIALSGKLTKDLTEDELEIIVNDEVQAIKSKYKGLASMALIAYLAG
jgi:hypothetical protein